MTNILIHLFIKNPDDVKDEKTRLAYSILASAAGLACNLLLFAVKIAAGLLMHAVSVISDGFNNLSDAVNCLITMFGYKLSARPADSEHPFGHGRLEYIISFIVSIIIFIFAWDLMRDSIEKIIHPEKVNFSLPLFLILAASVLVKKWMAGFYSKIGRKIDSLALQASAKDSRNDMLVTVISLSAIVMDAYTKNFPFDGIAGVVLSLFIFASGLSTAKDIITRIIGHPASNELVHAIRRQMLSHPEILGVHDLVIHDYGPGVQIGTAHAEMDSRMDFLKAHEVVDQAEEEIEQKLHVMMTIHMDPVVLGDPQTDAFRKKTEAALHTLDPELSIHDFRLIQTNDGVHLVFDVLVPFGCHISNEEIKKTVQDAFTNEEGKVRLTIHFDHGFIEEE